MSTAREDNVRLEGGLELGIDFVGDGLGGVAVPLSSRKQCRCGGCVDLPLVGIVVFGPAVA